jgi:hypothetical protein
VTWWNCKLWQPACNFFQQFIFLIYKLRDVAMRFPEWYFCATYRKPCDLILVKTCLCTFQRAPVTISTH